MSTARRLVLGLAAMALPLSAAVVATASPASARVTDVVGVPAADGTGQERMCVGIDDPDGQNTTWVCSPEAQWFGAVVGMTLSLIPA